MALRLFPTAMAALAALLVAGCDDDEAVALDVGPTGPPSILFADPPSGEAPHCVSVGNDAIVDVPLLVTVDEIVLRPPGGCGSYQQCGHLQLYADGVLNNESSVSTIALLMHKLADQFHDGSDHAGTGEPDVLSLRVAVANSAGEPLTDHDGAPLAGIETSTRRKAPKRR
jgi:hypothetical protein